MICNEWFRDEFQSTLPVRGATMLIRRNLKSSGYFNPRSPYGERLHTNQVGVCTDYFNPRSPYGERPRIFTQTLDKKLFQSTLPVRGATTNPGIRERRQANFNTLPVRGATLVESHNGEVSRNFNPRSPYGERQAHGHRQSRGETISIHAPRTGSDKTNKSQPMEHSSISIHAPRTGSDIKAPGSR